MAHSLPPRKRLQTFWAQLPRYWKAATIGVVLLGLLGGWQIISQWEDNTELDTLPPPNRPIEVVKTSEGEILDRLYEMKVEKFRDPTFRCQRLGLKQLGVISNVEPPLPQPTSQNPFQIAAEVLGLASPSQQIQAFYWQGRDTIFIQKNAPDNVFRHELAHAIEDQHTQRMEQVRQTQSFDRQLALRAAIEGTAIWASNDAPSKGQQINIYSKNLDQNEMIGRYWEGKRYVEQRVGGDPEAALKLQPANMYEVIFGQQRPGTLWNPPTPKQETNPQTASKECVNQLGVVGLMTVLRQLPVLSIDRQYIAESWVDDQFRFHPQTKTGTWKIALDDKRTADLMALMSQLQLETAQPGIKVEVTHYPPDQTTPGDSIPSILPSAWQ